MIFKNETAQNSFLYFLNEILQNNTFNLFNNFIYFDIFDNLLENKENLSYLLFDIGFDFVIENNDVVFTKYSFYGIL
jgi:hypothetical protein